MGYVRKWNGIGWKVMPWICDNWEWREDGIVWDLKAMLCSRLGGEIWYWLKLSEIWKPDNAMKRWTHEL